jgi:hypothetical protein
MVFTKNKYSSHRR